MLKQIFAIKDGFVFCISAPSEEVPTNKLSLEDCFRRALKGSWGKPHREYTSTLQEVGLPSEIEEQLGLMAVTKFTILEKGFFLDSQFFDICQTYIWLDNKWHAFEISEISKTMIENSGSNIVVFVD